MSRTTSMKYVALNGPAYSGKTTLARELEKQGYMMINFTDQLKELLVIALNAVGTSVTLEDIHRNKSRYRKLLQEFSEVIGYNHDPYFIFRALQPWEDAGRPPAVFDNVRFDAQFYHLSLSGFRLVRLDVTRVAQFKRAKDLNPSLTLPEFTRTIEHQSERPISEEWVDRVVMARLDKTIEELAREVMDAPVSKV